MRFGADIDTDGGAGKGDTAPLKAYQGKPAVTVVVDDMAGIEQASRVLQQYRDRLRAAEVEFSRYLDGGRGIGETDEDCDKERQGRGEGEEQDQEALRKAQEEAERAARANSLELQTFSYDVLEAHVWQKHEELVLNKMLPAEVI